MNAHEVTHPLPAASLARVGGWLYGRPQRWHSDMATDLGVSRNQVGRWARAEADVPLMAVLALRTLVTERDGRAARERAELEDLLS